MLNKVTRQVQFHAQSVAAAVIIVNSRRRWKRRSGIVTPPSRFATDTNKCHELTYDDDIENIDSNERLLTKKIQR